MINQLASRLDAVAFKIGFKEPVSHMEMVNITDFLKNQYSDFSMEEITGSFELGIAGKLGIKTEDIKHYQSFSVIYIAIFLNAYRVYRTQILKDAIPKLTLPAPKMDEAESKRIANESAKKRLLLAFEHLKTTGEYNLLDNGNIVYKYLDSLGIIPFDNAHKARIKEKAQRNLANEMLNQNQRKYKNVLENALKDLDAEIVKSEARRMALEKFLRTEAEMDQDLEALISLSEKAA